MPLLNPIMGMPIKFLTLTTAADVSLFSAAGSPAYPLDLRVTIATSNYLYGSTTGVYGFTVASFAPGSKITITNNGYIVGCGGAGGQGAVNPGGGANGTSGAQGGPALSVQTMSNVTVRIDNTSGSISSGGGGGGGGAGGAGDVGGNNWNVNSGGGGGGGYSYTTALGGAAGLAYGGVYNDTGGVSGAGGNGGGGGGGGGGVGGNAIFSVGGAGGAGGTAGATGADGYVNSGSFPAFTPGSGAPAGAAIVGNGNITWIATGVINGPIY